MKISILLVLLIGSFTVRGQIMEERILYVIDSIPALGDPEEDEGVLAEGDVDSETTLSNKVEIERRGYKDADRVIFIITKEYTRRPEELKRIPSIRSMERKGGTWHLKGSAAPYSGPFIDYYRNGKKQGDGTLKDGLIEGLRTVYFQDGTTSYFRNYSKGLANGESKEFFSNGKLEQEGFYKNDKDDGIWKEYYSTGQLKKETLYKGGKAVPTKEEEKFDKLLLSAIKMVKNKNYPEAIKTLDEAIATNANSCEAYFHKGAAYLGDLKYDQAIVEYDKAIAMEPLYIESLGDRAFARMLKYEPGASRTLGKDHRVITVAVKENAIPQDELEKICADLKHAKQLGDRNPLVLDAIRNHCQ